MDTEPGSGKGKENTKDKQNWEAYKIGYISVFGWMPEVGRASIKFRDFEISWETGMISKDLLGRRKDLVNKSTVKDLRRKGSTLIHDGSLREERVHGARDDLIRTCVLDTHLSGEITSRIVAHIARRNAEHPEESRPHMDRRAKDYNNSLFVHVALAAV